jgi:hypothetical protein
MLNSGSNHQANRAIGQRVAEQRQLTRLRDDPLPPHPPRVRQLALIHY